MPSPDEGSNPSLGPGPESSSRVPRARLDEISTAWSRIRDPLHFITRYGPALRRYLRAIIPDEQEGEDILQALALRVLERGFERATPERGRFRDYLRVSARNAALSRLKARSRSKPAAEALDRLEATGPDADPFAAAERAWLDEWRRGILDRAWRALEAHESRTPGNLFHTVLRLSVDHGDEPSDALAARCSRLAGRPLRPDAFRKQLSRARRRFAKLVVDEVKLDLADPSPDRVEEELVETGLMEHVRDFLPPDWRTKGFGDPE